MERRILWQEWPKRFLSALLSLYVQFFLLLWQRQYWCSHAIFENFVLISSRLSFGRSKRMQGKLIKFNFLFLNFGHFTEMIQIQRTMTVRKWLNIYCINAEICNTDITVVTWKDSYAWLLPVCTFNFCWKQFQCQESHWLRCLGHRQGKEKWDKRRKEIKPPLSQLLKLVNQVESIRSYDNFV